MQEEERILRAVLGAHSDIFDLHSVMATRLDDFVTEMERVRPTILHFAGHSTDEGFWLENENGTDHYIVGWEVLAQFLSHYRDFLDCVVFNSCNSHQPAFQNAFGSPHIHVITMPDALSTVKALAFTKRFYELLADGNIMSDAIRKTQAYLAMRGFSQQELPIWIQGE